MQLGNRTAKAWPNLVVPETYNCCASHFLGWLGLVHQCVRFLTAGCKGIEAR